MTKLQRNLSTPESRAFWEKAERTGAEVESWPDWKRAGINYAPQRREPRSTSSSAGEHT
jgi:hypothetical protein